MYFEQFGDRLDLFVRGIDRVLHQLLTEVGVGENRAVAALSFRLIRRQLQLRRLLLGLRWLGGLPKGVDLLQIQLGNDLVAGLVSLIS